MAGRPLLVPAVMLRPPGPALGSRASLYVGDLDDGVAEGHIYALFCQVAPVTSLRVCRDVTGRSIGYAYVNFYSREDGYGFVSFTTIEVIDGMNRKIVGKKPLYVGVAQRKEERRAMLVNTGVLAPAVPQNFAPRQFYVSPGVPGMFPPQMVYPNTNQAFTYMPNSMNVNANSVMVPPGFAQTDSTVSTPSVPSKNTTTTAVDSSYLEKQHPLEPELGGKVTGILGEAMEALQARKLEEARDTVDLATIPSSSTLSVSRDAIDPASTASSSSASADGANLAPSPSSSSA
ncbi:polyadenylate-binding protein, cytoplasmic and nuclear-like [Triticum urartu]|uniref:polyadenylate-binding protein, cytoplasmic and nuclear-like n=1 Tax=Triticum urartu TaxID=4572 RepID=UPI002042F82C|nr:polyadenylate-binding protein, cytoplasmic and nuclear-like [Triticum urartu]